MREREEEEEAQSYRKTFPQVSSPFFVPSPVEYITVMQSGAQFMSSAHAKRSPDMAKNIRHLAVPVRLLIFSSKASASAVA